MSLRTFSTLPNEITLDVWTRTMTDLKALQDSLQEEGVFDRIVPILVYHVSYFDTWRDDLIREKAQKPVTGLSAVEHGRPDRCGRHSVVPGFFGPWPAHPPAGRRRYLICLDSAVPLQNSRKSHSLPGNRSCFIVSIMCFASKLQRTGKDKCPCAGRMVKKRSLLPCLRSVLSGCRWIKWTNYGPQPGINRHAVTQGQGRRTHFSTSSVSKGTFSERGLFRRQSHGSGTYRRLRRCLPATRRRSAPGRRVA